MLDRFRDNTTFEADPRMRQWVEAGKGSLHYEGFMQFFIRGLGWLDVELIELDRDYYEKYWSNVTKDNMMLPEARIMSFKIAHLSELWVLGGWEAISTVSRRLGSPAIRRQYSDQVVGEVNRTKSAFLPVRSRLAKFEPEGDPKVSDSAFGAWPYESKGMSWVTPRSRVFRRDLSDQLLSALSALAAKMPHHKRPAIAHKRGTRSKQDR